MYLETWMIVALILSFGLCAFISRRSGFSYGAIATLEMLERERIIKVEEDGSVKRWTPYNEVPVKKKRRAKGVK